MTSQAYQTGDAAHSAQGRDDRARSRTIPAAKRSTAATFRNIQGPYHATGENRRIVTTCHKTPECSNGYRQKHRKHDRRSGRPILYSLYFQERINSLFFTLARCNQFFIVNNNKVQLIPYSLHQKVQLIVNCYYRKSAINCY